MRNDKISKLINGRIWQLSWPMMLSNLSVPLLAITDTFVLGHLDDAGPLAGVTIGANLFVSIVWVFGFLRMGTTSVIARTSRTEHGLILADSVRLAAIIAFILMSIFALAGPAMIALYGADSGVSDFAWQYLAIRALSVPIVLMNYAFLGWFIGRQDARTPMYVLILSNAINIVLDIWWVLGLQWGVAGAAMATVVADMVAFAICLIAIQLKHRLSIIVLVTAPLQAATQRWGELFRVNGHLLLRTLALLATFAYITRVGASYGELVLAANAIILQLLAVAAYALDGVANATESMVGRYSRYRNNVLISAAITSTGRWSLILALLICTLFWLAQGPVIEGITSIDTLRTEVQRYYLWVCVLPLASFLSYWYDGVCLGLGRTDVMLKSMAVALAIFAMIQLLVSTNHGLLGALALFNLTRGGAQWAMLRSVKPS